MKSKISPYPTCRQSWLGSSGFASLMPMRLVGLVVLLAASTASAERSDPAFLGVGMQDLGPQGPCQIDMVTKNSGAQTAGLQAHDIFVEIEGQPVTDCNSLAALIQAREPGDKVKVEVRRASMPVTVTATLFSRGEVMRQRYIGQTLSNTTLTRVEDQAESDLSSRGKTTIVGWYERNCGSGCEDVFAKIAKWSTKRSSRSAPIFAMAATTPDSHRSIPEIMKELKADQRKLDVPLHVTDRDTYSKLTVNDAKRMSFMVIDCKGIVQYAVPIKPDADDLTAILEELYSATEQASRTQRR